MWELKGKGANLGCLTCIPLDLTQLTGGLVSYCNGSQPQKFGNCAKPHESTHMSLMLGRAKYLKVQIIVV